MSGPHDGSLTVVSAGLTTSGPMLRIGLPRYRCTSCAWESPSAWVTIQPINVDGDGKVTRHCPRCYGDWQARQVRANVPEVESVP